MILNLLNLYTLIFALFGKVNDMVSAIQSTDSTSDASKTKFDAQTTRLAVMKANISHHAVPSELTTPWTVTSSPYSPSEEFEANVTESTVLILNATEHLADHSEPTVSFAASTPRPTPTTGVSCFQVVVDCSLVEPTTPSSDAEYDEYEEALVRSRRENADRTPTRTTPKSIGRLLDSLNAILRTLTRNSTRPPNSSTTSTAREIDTTPGTTPGTAPESLDELMSKQTSALRGTTANIETFTQSGAAEETAPTEEAFSVETSTLDAGEPSTEAGDASRSPASLCPLVVCPWNDTIGHFKGAEEADYNATAPCRGDNPLGCTPYWTSSRDEAVSSTVHSSSMHYSTDPRKSTPSKHSSLPSSASCAWGSLFSRRAVFYCP